MLQTVTVKRLRRVLAGLTSPDAKAKVGRPPGKGVYIGRVRAEPVHICAIDYTPTTLVERHGITPESCFPPEDDGVTWFDIVGVHDVELVGKLGSQLGLHALQAEDVVNTLHRSKAEVDGKRVFLILKMIRLDGELVDVEQLSLVLGPNFVATFQERAGDVLDVVRRRLREGIGRLRQSKADYLAYAIIDAVVDHYFVVLDHLARKLEDLEDQVLEEASKQALADMNDLRHELLMLRRGVWPLRELVRTLRADGEAVISPGVSPFLRDVEDHAIQLSEMIETFRDVLSGIKELYLSILSNRMNEIMKVLTLIGTLFIPLTFIVGVYGMNFEFMPELHWRYGYPLVMLLCVGLAAGLVWWFVRRKWL